MAKWLVCGSRTYSDEKALFVWLDAARRNFGAPGVVIHGGAKGADEMAGWWAGNDDIEVQVFPADWGKDGKAAGPIRNARMALLLDPGDRVFAFLDKPLKESRGTADMVRRAEARPGVSVIVFAP
jgi:hypothetical protein